MTSQHLLESLRQARTQLNKVVLGKAEVIDQMLCCLLADGHVLLEDLPGSGKTTLAKAFSATLGLPFSRIQFTSDLLPGDVTGFSMPLKGEMVFQKGPIFSQLLLADEINRASTKSQSALLEAMEEKQVSIDGQTYLLNSPFFVIATQNPSEQAGVNALPESQLDRFMMCLSLGYLDAETEIMLLQRKSSTAVLANCQNFLHKEDILQLQTMVNEVFVSPTLAQYVRRLLEATRESRLFNTGLSTRAGLALIQAAKARSVLQASQWLLPEHVQQVFLGIARHRLLEDASLVAHEAHLQELLDSVPVPL